MQNLKKISLSFLFLCLSLGIKAQDNKPHLTGIIKNYSKKEISITVHSFWEYAENSLWKKVITDEKGAFSFSVPFDGYPVRYVSLTLDNQSVFHKLILEPEDKIHVNLDFSKFEKSLRIEGNAAWKVAYYRQDEKYLSGYYSWNPTKPILPVEKHFALTDSLSKIRFQALEQVKKQASPIFQQLRQADLAGDISGRYPSFFEVQQMKLEKAEEECLSAYYDSLDLVCKLSFTPNQDKNLLFSDGYSMYASNLIWKLTGDLRQKTKYAVIDQNWIGSVYYQFKSLLIPPLAEKILGENILQSIGQEYGFAKDTLLLQDYLHTYPKSRYAPKIQKIYNAILRFQAGKPAYNFELENMEGKKVKLTDFKGKLVMIDFWGTWCGSCRKEHPFLKNVCKSLENTDFQVILISFNDNKTGWQEYVKNKELELPNIINLWADDPQTDLLQEYYNFSAAPHKVMIDKKGNLLEWKHNHFTPDTSQEIQKDVEKILQK